MTIEITREQLELIESAVAEIQGIGHIMKTLTSIQNADPMLLPMRGLGMRLDSLASVIWCSVDNDAASVPSLRNVLSEGGRALLSSNDEDVGVS